MFGLSMNNLPHLLMVVLPVGIMSVTIHEVAHGWMARRFGDPTAEMQGRLSLNPIKHLDPIGTLAIFLVGFGWAKPVPVDPRYFKRPGHDMMWVGLAGPISNLTLAIASAFLLRGTFYLHNNLDILSGEATLGLIRFFQFGVVINVVLAAFNMIPIPPLDGSRVLAYFLPPQLERKFRELDRYGLMIVVVVIFILPWATNGRIDIVRSVAGAALSAFQAIFL
jgi:Zn-dependent protease